MDINRLEEGSTSEETGITKQTQHQSRKEGVEDSVASTESSSCLWRWIYATDWKELNLKKKPQHPQNLLWRNVTSQKTESEVAKLTTRRRRNNSKNRNRSKPTAKEMKTEESEANPTPKEMQQRQFRRRTVDSTAPKKGFNFRVEKRQER